MKIINQPANFNALSKPSLAPESFSAWLNQPNSTQGDSYYIEHLEEFQKNALRFDNKSEKDTHPQSGNNSDAKQSFSRELLTPESSGLSKSLPWQKENDAVPLTEIVALENDFNQLIGHFSEGQGMGFISTSIRFETQPHKPAAQPAPPTAPITRRPLNPFQLFVENNELELALAIPEQLESQRKEIIREIRELVSSKGFILKN